MANQNLAELIDGQVLQANPLATVTRDCIIIRDSARQSHTIISLSHLSGMKRIRTTYPALLVISSGLFLISAAAFYSKQGGGAALPVSLLGGAFAVGYVLSRKACVSFTIASGSIETANGSLSETAALMAAVQAAQRRPTPKILADFTAGEPEPRPQGAEA